MNKIIPLDANMLNGIEVKMNNLLYDKISKSSKISIKTIKKSLILLSNFKRDIKLKIHNEKIRTYKTYADSSDFKIDFK